MIPMPIRRWMQARRTTSFFLFAYAISWGLWLPIILGYDGPLRAVLFVAGIFGPALAAALLVRLSGGGFLDWLSRSVLRRPTGRWWAVTFLLPVTLTTGASLGYVLLGHAVDVSLLPRGLAGYLPALLATALIGGGQEEVGWRGYALPRLEARFGPVGGTLVLGVLWGLWHLPIVAADPAFQHGLDASALIGVIGLSLVSVVGYAFFITWVFNRTGSVVLAMVLHAGFNTSNSHLIPLPSDAVEGAAYASLSLAMTLTLIVAVGVLVAATRGQLGYDRETRGEPARGPTAPSRRSRAAACV